MADPSASLSVSVSGDDDNYLNASTVVVTPYHLPMSPHHAVVLGGRRDDTVAAAGSADDLRPGCVSSRRRPASQPPVRGSIDCPRAVHPTVARLSAGGEDVPAQRSRSYSAVNRAGASTQTSRLGDRAAPAADWLAALGICAATPARRPDMAAAHCRTRTFADGAWPPPGRPACAAIEADALVAAGFFYNPNRDDDGGFDDTVTCFHCGGNLNQWQPDDCPFFEHGKHFPACGYVKLCAPEPERLPVTEKPEAARPNHVAEASQLESDSNVNDGHVSAIDSRRPSTDGGGRRSADDRLLCKVCMERQACVVLLGCAHLCTCVDCAAPLNRCPICRRPVTARIRAYIP